MSRLSDISFRIELDDKNIPHRIQWDATEKPEEGPEDTRAIAISIWDGVANNTLRMDLWTKEMSVDDMKRFCVDSIGGMAETVKNATGDEKMADMMQTLCRQLVKHIDEEQKLFTPPNK